MATILNEKELLGAFKLGYENEFFSYLNEFIPVIQKAMGYQGSWEILANKNADDNKLLQIIKSGTY